MTMDWFFVEAQDVLALRGNRSLSGPGAHGDSLFPPRPSVLAGALRRVLLDHHGVDPSRYRGRNALPGELGEVLGDPERPGRFRLATLLVARRDENGDVEPLLPLPADVAVFPEEGGGGGSRVDGAGDRSAGAHDDRSGSKRAVVRLEALPRAGLPAFRGSGALPSVAVLRGRDGKPERSGWFLDRAGIEAWVAGRTPSPAHLVSRADLWKVDHRLGIALDRSRRTVRRSMLYTSADIAPRDDVGLLVGVAGARGLWPRGIFRVRLGGEGRTAHFHPVRAPEEVPPVPPPRSKGDTFHVLLVTPGAFGTGWLLPGVREEHGVWRWRTGHFEAALEAAWVGGWDVVSGWNLAAGTAWPAERAIPSGSVYRFRIEKGELSASAIEDVIQGGLWTWLGDGPAAREHRRRAEGYGIVWLGA